VRGRPDLTTPSGRHASSWNGQPQDWPVTGDVHLKNPSRSRSSPASHPACMWGLTASAPSGGPQKAGQRSYPTRMVARL